MATANNTVSILINGSVAKEISEEYGVDPKRSASLLDIFSCVWQGLLPYGAQILFACALITNLDSPFQVISMCWYQYIFGNLCNLICCLGRKKEVGCKSRKAACEVSIRSAILLKRYTKNHEKMIYWKTLIMN